MDKLRKTATALDRMFRALFWVDVTMAIVCAVALAAAMAMGSDSGIYRAFINRVDIGNVRVSPLPEYCPQTVLPVAIRLAIVIAAGVSFGWGITIFRGILKPMTEGNPFEGGVASRLKKLALLTLVAGAVLSVMQAVCAAVDFGAFRVAELFNMQKLSEVVVMNRIDATFIIVSLVLFLLSFIFRYGETLQQLSDETL